LTVVGRPHTGRLQLAGKTNELDVDKAEYEAEN